MFAGIIVVLLTVWEIRAVDLHHSAVHNGRNDRHSISSFVAEPDKVSDKRVFKPHNSVVKDVKDGTWRIQMGETHVLESVGPMREEYEQEKQFVPMSVDETGASSSLQRNRIDNVESRCEDSLVEEMTENIILWFPSKKF